MSAQVQLLTFEPVDPFASAEPRADAVERAIDLAFELAHDILNDPAILDRIPDGTAMILLPSADPEVAQMNTLLGSILKHQGARVQEWVAAPRSGTPLRYDMDLTDARWGPWPRSEFGGRTAAQMRAIFAGVIAEGVRGPGYEVALLNGLPVYVEEEIEPGHYRFVAVARVPDKE